MSFSCLSLLFLEGGDRFSFPLLVVMRKKEGWVIKVMEMQQEMRLLTYFSLPNWTDERCAFRACGERNGFVKLQEKEKKKKEQVSKGAKPLTTVFLVPFFFPFSLDFCMVRMRCST